MPWRPRDVIPEGTTSAEIGVLAPLNAEQHLRAIKTHFRLLAYASLFVNPESIAKNPFEDLAGTAFGQFRI
jgi:hypothetical protein